MDAPGTSGSDSKEIHTGWMIVVMVGAWPHSGASQALRAYFRYRAASGDALLGRPATGHGRCGGRDRPRRLTTCHEVFPLCRETARSVAFCSARSLASLRRYDCPRRRRSCIATRGTPTLTRPGLPLPFVAEVSCGRDSNATASFDCVLNSTQRRRRATDPSFLEFIL